MDQKLQLNVVPMTKMVELCAPTFNYSKVERQKAETKQSIMGMFPQLGRHFKRLGLPPKVRNWTEHECLRRIGKGIGDEWDVCRWAVSSRS